MINLVTCIMSHWHYFFPFLIHCLLGFPWVFSNAFHCIFQNTFIGNDRIHMKRSNVIKFKWWAYFNCLYTVLFSEGQYDYLKMCLKACLLHQPWSATKSVTYISWGSQYFQPHTSLAENVVCFFFLILCKAYLKCGRTESNAVTEPAKTIQICSKIWAPRCQASVISKHSRFVYSNRVRLKLHLIQFLKIK